MPLALRLTLRTKTSILRKTQGITLFRSSGTKETAKEIAVASLSKSSWIGGPKISKSSLEGIPRKITRTITGHSCLKLMKALWRSVP
jgi:hypothetical protein